MELTVLGYGAVAIGRPEVDQALVDRLLNEALDAGLNVIDTAECYGASEERIGKAIAHRRSEYYLFTKTGHALPDENEPDWEPGLLARSIDRSLKRLRTDCVDLVQLHSCSEELLRRGEVIEVLVRAREAGKTRFIGYSGDGAAARYALECGLFDSLQTSVNIADQEAIDLLLPLAVEKGIGVIAKRPIANACWRAGERPESPYHHVYWDRLQVLDYPFLRDLPLEESIGIALRFTLMQPGVTTAIVGTGRPGRWMANARHVEAGPLPHELHESIRARWHEVGAGWEGQT